MEEEYIPLIESNKVDTHSVYISNLPNDVTKFELNELVTSNNLKPLHCIVATNRKTLSKYGFVIFHTAEQANECISTLNKTSYCGQLLNVEISKPKSNKLNKLKRTETIKNSFIIKGYPLQANENQVRKSISSILNGMTFSLVQVGDKWRIVFDSLSACLSAATKLSSIRVKIPSIGNVIIHSVMPKIVTNSKSSKIGRIFIKNLPFDITSDELASKFAKIDPNCVVHFKDDKNICNKGFAFIQFNKIKSALKALKLSGSKIKGRKIEINLAVSKEYFTGDEHDVLKSKDKILKGNDDVLEGKNEHLTVKNNEKTSKIKKQKVMNRLTKSHSQVTGSDVSEGKTAFVQNVPFEATQEQLEVAFRVYGEIEYVTLVKDSAGRNKGTAFIKYKDKESLDSLLSAEDNTKATLSEYLLEDSLNSSERIAENLGIALLGRKLRVIRAVSRDEAKEFESTNNKVDKRRLYLLDESLNGITEEQREILHKGESREGRISNPNTFVSDKRICIRNLPLYITKESLRDLLKKNVKGIGKIQLLADKKRKVMNLKGNKIKRGKRFGFVEFKTKEQAKEALKFLNSTDAFGQKLVAEFSLEDKRALVERKRKASLKDANGSNKNGIVSREKTKVVAKSNRKLRNKKK